MRRRPGESPQRSGRRFEAFWAKLFGVVPQRGSGSSWLAKLDVRDTRITFSCKWTEKDSFRLTREFMREADQAIYENGDNSVPAMAISIDNGEEVLVTMRAEDFIRLVTSKDSRYVAPTRGEQKRIRAGMPSLLRDAPVEPRNGAA
jgi:hypothetical protein